MPASLRSLVARLKGLVVRDESDDGFGDEVETHLRLLIDRFIRQGMTPAEAQVAARRQFGNVAVLRQDRQDMQTLPSAERMWRAVRYGSRQLRSSPLFTAMAVLSLALGIGANTAIFTLLDQVMLRLLPVAGAERLVMIWSTGPTLGSNRGNRVSSFPLCQDYQRDAAALESVFCRYVAPAALTIGGATEPVQTELVTGNYFEALHIGASAGRVFSADADDRVDRGHPVVVLSHGFWTTRFGGSPDVIGKTILLNRQPMEVIGVAARGFHGIDAIEAPHLWIPVRMKAVLMPEEDGLNDRDYHFLQVFGRLRSGQTVASARASLTPLFRRILEQELHNPDVAAAPAGQRERFLNRTLIVERASSGYSDVRQHYATPLIALMGMAALILLLACSNVAGLLIARGMARRREMAVRLSIGAGRRVLIEQLLVESLLLAFAGAIVGLLLAMVVTQVLLGVVPFGSGILLLHAAPDLRILLFSTGVGVGTVLLCGLVPALQATRVDIVSALKASTVAMGAATGPVRLRRVLVATQMGLSVLLLVGAGLFAKTLINLKGTDTGLHAIDSIVTFRVDPAKNGYTAAQVSRFYGDLLTRVATLPGVENVAYAWVPVLEAGAPEWTTRIEGYVPSAGENMEIAGNVISPGYWQTMGVTLIDGRDFTESDRFTTPEPGQLPTVAIVNRSFAQRFFGNRTAVGGRFGIGDDKDAHGVRIIGVVEDTLHAGPRAGRQPQIFFSFLQMTFPVPAVFYARVGRSPQGLIAPIRHAISALEATMPVSEMKTLDRSLNDTLGAERLIATLSGVFAMLATLIAALGLYGVVSYSVERRTTEIGLRMALGAAPASVLMLIMREAVTLVGIGLLIGLPCALMLGHYVAAQLFGTEPTDWRIAAAASATLGVVALLAGFVPAQRARRLDPLAALRQE